MAQAEAETLQAKLDKLLADNDTPGVESLLASLSEEAESGREPHQLVLGRYHYTQAQVTGNADGQTDKQGHAEKAVNYLIKASKQGNQAATELLAECCEKNLGVTEETLPDVRWCLQTPQYEKIARQAARELFKKINPLQPEGKSLNQAEYNKALGTLNIDTKERKLLEKAGKVKSGDEPITETQFIDKMMRRLHGYGGISLDSILQQDVEWEAYTNATWLQKVTKYPGKTFSWMIDHAIEVTGKQGMTWLKSLIPTNQIYMLMIFFLYSLISLEIVFWFVPLLVFYVAFMVLLICTLQMFYARRKTRDVKAIADMLKRFNDALSSDSAESAYTWSSMTPYVVFFVALIATILSFLLADKTWIPCAEITFIASFFTVGCFFALSDKYDHLAILSMVFDSISTLPALMEGFPQIPVVYHILSFFLGSGITIELLPDMYLQFGIPSLAYLVVPTLFLRMARQNSWQGTYRVLVPHLVCFFWWRLAMLFFRHSSWLSMVRASIGWAAFILLLPFLIVFLFIWLVMYLSSVLTVSNMLKITTTILLLAIPAGFAFWAKSGFKIKGFKPNLESNKIKVVMAVIFALSVLPLTFLFSPPERDVKGHYVTWDQYKLLCSQPHWDQSNIADAMITCSHLAGTMVDWTGSIKKVVIKQTMNQAEGFINHLPWALGNYLRCTYGEEYPDCDSIQSQTDRLSCQINTLQGRQCHMKNLDRYVFEIWVHMPLDGDTVHDVRIETSHWFKSAVLKLKGNDQVQFRASLKAELGNTWPVLKLYYINCLSCTEPVELGSSGLTSKLLETYGILLHFKRSFQGVWNFFLAPVVEFYHAGNM